MGTSVAQKKINKQPYEVRRRHMVLSEEQAREYGTFKDSLRAAIHRWFKYPAGYSYRLIETKIGQYKLDENCWILDPFVGCGTTSVVAKSKGVNSIGIEAHPFVFEAAQTKVFWEYDLEALERSISEITSEVTEIIDNGGTETVDLSPLPKLVRKCYSPENLAKLVVIRDTISQQVSDEHIRRFVNLALTDTLRTAAKAATGWPYIAPAKMHQRKTEKDGLEEFCKQAWRMHRDLRVVLSQKRPKVECILIEGDARERHPKIRTESIDLAITSPPYLNNYDYADRTRLETYFFGMMSSWGEITREIRDKLMVAATTQIRRSDYDEEHLVTDDIRRASPTVYAQLADKVKTLGEVRLHKGGRKSYDIMVATYFDDMLKVLKQVYNALKKDADFVLVLGDSAPYGVYIPTEEYLGQLALGIGFSFYMVEVLRERGGKWANNPQRHKVPLKESILTLVK